MKRMISFGLLASMMIAPLVTLHAAEPAPQFKGSINNIDIAAWNCSYSSCYKQFSHLPIDIPQLHDNYKVVKLTFTNNSATRYVIHNRNIELPLVEFPNIAYNNHLARWWGLFSSEVMLQGITPLLAWIIWTSKPGCQDAYINGIKKMFALGGLLTLKDRVVDGIRRCGKKNDENLNNITNYFAQDDKLKSYHVLEPGAVVTKTIIIKKEDYASLFLVRLVSHDYTATPHTIDFEVEMQ